MKCISSKSALVLVNGSPTQEFKLGRRLRQGDLLSLFLFFIVEEDLNTMMSVAVDNKLFKGFQVSYCLEFQVSHLQFAYDTLILREQIWSNIRTIKALLVLFELVYGLKINFHKSMLVGVDI